MQTLFQLLLTHAADANDNAGSFSRIISNMSSFMISSKLPLLLELEASPAPQLIVAVDFPIKNAFLNFDNHSLCTFTAFTKPNYSALGNDLATRGALSFVFFFCFFFENFVVDAYASFYLTSYFSTVTTVLPSKKIIIMDLTLQYKWNEKYYMLFNEIYILGAI